MNMYGGIAARFAHVSSPNPSFSAPPPLVAPPALLVVCVRVSFTPWAGWKGAYPAPELDSRVVLTGLVPPARKATKFFPSPPPLGVPPGLAKPALVAAPLGLTVALPTSLAPPLVE